MIPASWFLVLSTVLFALGLAAFFLKRDLVSMLLSVEIMLNAANLAFLAFARSARSLDGQVIVLFIVTVAAAEAAAGAAIMLLFFRTKRSVRRDAADIMKG
jgi:NADH-quinone oxidoreductase subunit K